MRNFKKILSLLMAFVLVLGTVTIVNADKSFSDLPASHWGYSYVQTLVGDGTINGYQDGTFRPEANVTRAEFVKMIGKTDKVFETPFEDITGHWAYDYIMYSDMDVEGTKFNPDVAITRDDVIGLLWKRAGSPKAYAPGIITNQSAKPDAAAWAYAYGIMTGDDGVTMRLSDGVTRVEAAALICRSRTVNESSKKEFSSTVDNKIIENVYEGVGFLGEYDPNKTYTNGELAGYAMQLLYETSTPMFDGVQVDIPFNRNNALAFSVACNHVWGNDKKTEAFYDAKATNLDAVALFTFVMHNKSYASLIDGSKDDFYADVKSVDNDSMNILVSAAHKKGIRLDNTDNIYPDKELTGKNLALILTQLDMLGGFNSALVVKLDISAAIDTPIKTEILKYPNNSDKFNMILKDVPNAVYHSDFIDVDGTVCNSSTKDTFRFARDNSDLFGFFIESLQYKMLEEGVYTSITYYPSLVCESENGYIMKVRVKVVAYDETKSFDDLFPGIVSGEKPDLKTLPTFYATLATGSKFSGISIPITNAKFTTIDYIN